MGKIKKDKNSKNSHDKKSKGELSKKRKNGEKKKTSNDEGNRKYGYISANSVITMAEAAGFTGIQEEVAKNLAEDVTYRLRYIIQQCKKYMTHSRHKKLTCSDINEVFKMCDVPAIYGYNVDSALHNFIYIKEADVYVLEDNTVDLPAFALTEIVVEQRPSLMISGSWLKPEDGKAKPEGKSKGEDARSGNGEAQTSENLKHMHSISPNYESQKASNESAESETKIPTNLIKYYGITCNTILGHSDLKVVFQDLSTSSRILPIIPYLLNFITMTLNKLASERQIKRLLQSVEALSKNVGIDFSPYLATTRVINAMLLVVAVDKMNYDYHLRAYAARVLSIVLARWCTRDEQRTIVIAKMGKLLGNLKASVKVHYGAIVLLTALGPEALNLSFWGMLDQYLAHLEKLRQDRDQKSPNADVAMLEHVVLLAAVLLYRFPVSEGQDGEDGGAAAAAAEEEEERVRARKLDQYLYSYFGDAVCNIRLNLLENPRFVASVWRENCRSASEAGGGGGGEGKESVKDRDGEEGGGRDSRRGRSSLARTWKYLRTEARTAADEGSRLAVENVFAVPKAKRKRNSRILFKFAGAIPVPEVSLRRKRMDAKYSQYVAGKGAEGHAILVGKFRKIRRIRPYSSVHLPVGCIYSVL